MRKKIGIVILLGCLIVGTVGCSIRNMEEKEKKEASQVAESERPEIYEPIAHVDEERIDKEETVVAKADAKGNVEETTVSVVLKNPGGLENIQDISNLTDIKNIDGDEEFVQDGDNLEWQNHGKNISYKGSSDEKLPVSVQVQYFLEGQEIAPSDLAGKSGHIKMCFKLTNNTDFVPFMCLTMVSMEDSKFYNVTSKNGTVKYMDGAITVIGTTFPGLEEELKLADNKTFNEIEFKDSFEIEADTDDFGIEFTETIATNDIFDNINDKDIDRYKDDADDMKDSDSATSKMEEGIRKFKNGAGNFKAGLKKYTAGVNSCAKGAKQLKSGLKELKKYTKILPAEVGVAIENLYAGASELSGGLNKLSKSGGQLNTAAESMEKACDTMQSGVDKLKKEAFNKMSDSGKDISEVLDKITTLKKAGKDYNNFSGVLEGKTSAVLFMIETAEIN